VVKFFPFRRVAFPLRRVLDVIVGVIVFLNLVA